MRQKLKDVFLVQMKGRFPNTIRLKDSPPQGLLDILIKNMKDKWKHQPISDFVKLHSKGLGKYQNHKTHKIHYKVINTPTYPTL